jgi:hypothetical protein
LKKLQGIEENKHLSKAVAAAVETMVHENTMIPATPVEDQPKVKRAERRAKVKTASKPAENAAPKGWDAVEGGTVAEDETPRVAPKVKGPRINAKATLDADEMAAL